jgi:hypothetical protein
MSRTTQYGRSAYARALCALLGGVWAAFALTTASAAPPVAGSVLYAEVIAVSPRQLHGMGAGARGRVMVRLDTGTRHRLIMRRPLPRVGDWMPVEVVDVSASGALTLRPHR